MTKWKLVRQDFGDEEFTFSEGDEVTIGRGKKNSISLTSIVVSRDHCSIRVNNNSITLTDLKSSNGVYIGNKKIPPNIPCDAKNLDIIGLGWSPGTALINIQDCEKYVFKLIKELPLIDKTTLHNDAEMDEIEDKIAIFEGNKEKNYENTEPPPISNKRKFGNDCLVTNIKPEITEKGPFVKTESHIINISDSENENLQPGTLNKKPKLVSTNKTEKQVIKTEPIKAELEFEFEAFNVKQEYLTYDDEPLQVDSDSDSESDQWFIRLSQSSPGKPFTKVATQNKDDSQENSSYSQMEDFVLSGLDDNNELFENDIITILPQRLAQGDNIQKTNNLQSDCAVNSSDHDQIQSNNVTSTIGTLSEPMSKVRNQILGDFVDGISEVRHTEPLNNQSLQSRRAHLIKPLVPNKKSTYPKNTEKVQKRSTKSKYDRKKKDLSNKCELSHSQKEERKRRLKEIACKGKKDNQLVSNNIVDTSSNKFENIKDSSSDRAELTEQKTKVRTAVHAANLSKPQPKDKDGQFLKDSVKLQLDEKMHNKKPDKSETANESKRRKEHSSRREVKPSIQVQSSSAYGGIEAQLPISMRPPTTGKTLSNVSGPKKPKKSVRFSDTEPQVHIFEIEPGNNMKKTSLIKTSLVDIRQMPVFSLEKLTLMKILRWNPHWLEEQMNNNDPPPILGHNNPPMSIFHSFVNHHQYVQLIGDLLLMEIWECLTIAYKKIRNDMNCIEMRIESLPPVPTQDRYFELFNLSVNVSLPTAMARLVPKVGEIILVDFGPENGKNQRFFFVHNVRCLPSPANNIHSFYSISLHATFTDKMRLLRPGGIMLGRVLADIKKELMLFDAMEQLAGSPLSETILKPEPHHFPKMEIDPNIKSQWTSTLNPSQQLAVSASVTAALGDRPCVQMVQGPPGTGKSSVICAIVMTYFYGPQVKRHQNRGKILICATSNAAVDELVIRLLNIRQSLPKSERFRMVRVGRVEAMHPRARDVSSQQLAQRDLAQAPAAMPVHPPGLAQEICHLEAKINMWQAAAQDAKDSVRVAYCQGRVNELVKRITLVRGGGGAAAGARGAQLAQAERRIVEGADIIITTLASAHNYKMQGIPGNTHTYYGRLKRRIALCIVDEAGQAIEPETLIPLTLDVTRLTLIGDPQQLPGYICSQRAKRHGLSESLFSRLASCGEQWAAGQPAVLLDQQYRMHPAIADYPNRAFYGGLVTSVGPRRPDLPLPPYALVTIASGDKGQGASGANETEAWGVARLAGALDALLRPRGLSLAVITPYHAHKDLIKKCLRHLYNLPKCESGDIDGPVEVNTVDSFQGQERDVVLVSLARSHGVGFLTDAGRMNVMLTRARHTLLICLNPHAMLKNPQWRTLIEDAQRRKVYKVFPYKMCQPSNTLSDDVTHYITKTLNEHSKR